jgi:shikimate dehydrogenase
MGLSGATRLNVIIGDPIAQVRAPHGVTQAMAARGCDAILVPVHVAPRDLSDFMAVVARIQNLDGMIVTVPHKFACYRFCADATDRAHFLGAVNLMRRRIDGQWHGDMSDGFGFVAAATAKGVNPKGMRVLLVGAGGAGSAIALALVDAGARSLAVHDRDAGRRDALIERLNRYRNGIALTGSSDPRGYDFVANATPAGMHGESALPIDVAGLAPSSYCGCVVTEPAVSSFIEAARRIGCVTSTGTEMYQAQQERIVDFLLSVD